MNIVSIPSDLELVDENTQWWWAYGMWKLTLTMAIRWFSRFYRWSSQTDQNLGGSELDQMTGWSCRTPSKIKHRMPSSIDRGSRWDRINEMISIGTHHPLLGYWDGEWKEGNLRLLEDTRRKNEKQIGGGIPWSEHDLSAIWKENFIESIRSFIKSRINYGS